MKVLGQRPDDHPRGRGGVAFFVGYDVRGALREQLCDWLTVG